MGGRGSSSGRGGGAKSEIQNRLAGNQIELDYALMKSREWGNIKGGGTLKSREMFYQWNDEVRRLQEERRLLESVPKINNPAGIPDNAMTQDEFLMLKGFGSPVSNYGVDKIGGANMTRMSTRQRQKTYQEIDRKAVEYSQQRNNAKAEYDNLVKAGIIRDKTATEKMITTAHGNPDNTAVQAARRMAERRGINWKTGKKLRR